MPRFDYNPAEAVAGFPVYDKGRYEFVLGEPVSFYRSGKPDAKTGITKDDNYGVFFKSKCATDGPMKDKPYMTNCYMHQDDARNFAKQVQMAALGFARTQEAEFNEKSKEYGWGFNPDDKTCEDGWHAMKGQYIVVEFDSAQLDATTNEKKQGKTLGIYPLGVDA